MWQGRVLVVLTIAWFAFLFVGRYALRTRGHITHGFRDRSTADIVFGALWLAVALWLAGAAAPTLSNAVRALAISAAATASAFAIRGLLRHFSEP